MSLIRRAAGPNYRRSFGDSHDDPYAIPTNGTLSRSSAGVMVNEKVALQLLAVTACVRLISETLSNLSLDAIKTDENGLETKVAKPPSIIADPFNGANKLNGITPKSGLAQMCVSTLLRGNAYGAVTSFDSHGYPQALRIVSPGLVEVDYDDDGEKVFKVKGEPFPSERMLHVTGMTLPGEPAGLSVIEYARRTIGLGVAAEEFGSQFFGRGANMTGIISVPGDLKDGAAKRIRENFEAKHGGLSNAFSLGVLTGGAKFEKTQITPEEAQFLLTRAMQTTDIAMLYGVPPHMLGQVDRTTSWGKGIEEQTLGFVKYTMLAWAKRFEDAWSAMMARSMTAKFDFSDLLRPDSSARFLTYQVARNSSIFTPNEIRGRENMPPVEGGDDLFAPLNSAHATEPDWQPGKPEEAPDAGGDSEPPADNPDDQPKGKGK